MNNVAKPPTLLDREATGGDIAEGGFNFQGDLILTRIPHWLACDGFTGMIREALGDTEALFFVPQFGMTREFIEYKNYTLSPQKFWPEIERFQKMDTTHPGSYWRFSLVCTGVSDRLRSMLNALRRVRDAFPFYDNAPTIQDASYSGYVDTIVKHGKDEALALFIFDKVIIETDPQKSTEQGFNAFRSALEKHFPFFQNLGLIPAQTAWNALSDVSRRRKAQLISRAEIELAIWSGVKDTHSQADAFRVFTANEPLASKWEFRPELCFDWSAFSGGSERIFPPSEDWNKLLVGQLQATKNWIFESGRNRRIILKGQRRLSATVALGSVFNSVSGFAIDMYQGEQVWSTDAHATTSTPEYEWQITPPENIEASEIAVAISIGRNIAPEVSNYLTTQRLNIPILTIIGRDSLFSAHQTNAAVRTSKMAILDAVTKTGAKVVHLFLATPSQFGLFLGHRMNSMGVIQCYERVRPNVYQETCRLAHV